MAHAGSSGHDRRKSDGETPTSVKLSNVMAAAGVLLGITLGDPASAQKPGGILKVYFFDSPASMSIHEEATFAALGPMMGVFNNLVMYDQHVPLYSLESIVPDL